MTNVFCYEPFYDFDNLLEQVLGGRHGPSAAAQRPHDAVDRAVKSLKPRMDLHENGEKNLVTATFEFPGVPKENVQIDIHNGRLTVSAETKRSADFDEAGYAVHERRFGKFSRTLQLPQGIKEDVVQASLENGVLTVTFPKSTPEQAPKRIQIA
ncbi:small heat shock protein [Pholiota conissans]|uniref:Small heat shock protein n=1 Tax=Pholiota conissans TaxID=109636 RepID=A0A9P5ZBU6_9AGAR|nr:small heat shock protein [Pholiota conissans]